MSFVLSAGSGLKPLLRKSPAPLPDTRFRATPRFKILFVFKKPKCHVAPGGKSWGDFRAIPPGLRLASGNYSNQSKDYLTTHPYRVQPKLEFHIYLYPYIFSYFESITGARAMIKICIS